MVMKVSYSIRTLGPWQRNGIDYRAPGPIGSIRTLPLGDVLPPLRPANR